MVARSWRLSRLVLNCGDASGLGAKPAGNPMDRLQSLCRKGNAGQSPLSGVIAKSVQRPNLSGDRLAYDHG